MHHFSRLAFVLATSLSGVACSTHGYLRDVVESNYNKVSNDIKTLVQTEQRQAEQGHSKLVTERPWVGVRPVRLDKALPSVFSKRVVLNEPYPTPIETFLRKMTDVSGILMSFEYDIVDGGRKKTNTGAPEPMSLGGMDSALDVQIPPPVDLSGSSMSSGRSKKDIRITLNYRGDVKGMLDAAATAMHANWKYEEQGNRVVFYRYVTKTFYLSMVPGSAESTSEVGTAAGNSQTSSKFNGNLSIWGTIKDAIDTMLSSDGVYSISEATGTITVRDVPDVVQRVEGYIKKLNDSFSRQVTIDVKIYRVSQRISDIRGINWDALFKSAGFNLNVTTPRLETTGLSSVVLSVPDTAVGEMRHWVGSQAFLDMLSKIGRVSVVTNITLKTVNNQPVPIRVGRKIAYLKEIQQTSTSNVGSTVSMTPGEVDVGFTMQVLPQVQENGRDVLVQIMMSLSNLDSMETFSSGGNTLQLPQVSSRDFMQRVWLSSGQTLVLAGFESNESNDNRGSPLDAEAWMFGGSREMMNNRESIVVFITPVVSTIKDTL